MPLNFLWLMNKCSCFWVCCQLQVSSWRGKDLLKSLSSIRNGLLNRFQKYQHFHISLTRRRYELLLLSYSCLCSNGMIHQCFVASHLDLLRDVHLLSYFWSKQSHHCSTNHPYCKSMALLCNYATLLSKWNWRAESVQFFSLSNRFV